MQRIYLAAIGVLIAVQLWATPAFAGGGGDDLESLVEGVKSFLVQLFDPFWWLW